MQVNILRLNLQYLLNEVYRLQFCKTMFQPRNNEKVLHIIAISDEATFYLYSTVNLQNRRH